jgi:hypothetical protein
MQWACFSLEVQAESPKMTDRKVCLQLERRARQRVGLQPPECERAPRAGTITYEIVDRTEKVAGTVPARPLRGRASAVRKNVPATSAHTTPVHVGGVQGSAVFRSVGHLLFHLEYWVPLAKSTRAAFWALSRTAAEVMEMALTVATKAKACTVTGGHGGGVCVSWWEGGRGRATGGIVMFVRDSRQPANLSPRRETS